MYADLELEFIPKSQLALISEELDTNSDSDNESVHEDQRPIRPVRNNFINLYHFMEVYKNSRLFFAQSMAFPCLTRLKKIFEDNSVCFDKKYSDQELPFPIITEILTILDSSEFQNWFALHNTSAWVTNPLNILEQADIQLLMLLQKKLFLKFDLAQYILGLSQEELEQLIRFQSIFETLNINHIQLSTKILKALVTHKAPDLDSQIFLETNQALLKYYNPQTRLERCIRQKNITISQEIQPLLTTADSFSEEQLQKVINFISKSQYFTQENCKVLLTNAENIEDFICIYDKLSASVQFNATDSDLMYVNAKRLIQSILNALAKNSNVVIKGRDYQQIFNNLKEEKQDMNSITLLNIYFSLFFAIAEPTPEVTQILDLNQRALTMSRLKTNTSQNTGFNWSLFSRDSASDLKEITIDNPLWFGYKLTNEDPIYPEFSKLYRQIQLIITKNIPITLPEQIRISLFYGTFDNTRENMYIRIINSTNTNNFREFCQQYNEHYRYDGEDRIDFLDTPFIKFFIKMSEYGAQPKDILKLKTYETEYNTEPDTSTDNSLTKQVLQNAFQSNHTRDHEDIYNHLLSDCACFTQRHIKNKHEIFKNFFEYLAINPEMIHLSTLISKLFINLIEDNQFMRYLRTMNKKVLDCVSEIISNNITSISEDQKCRHLNSFGTEYSHHIIEQVRANNVINAHKESIGYEELRSNGLPNNRP